MKILMMATSIFPDTKGGSFKYIYDISKGLSNKGHSIYLITQKTKNTANNENIKGIFVYRYKTLHYLPILFYLTVFLNSFILSKKILKQKQFNLIHTHSLISGFSGTIFSKIYKIPLIHTFHAAYYQEYQDRINFQFKNKIYKIIKKIESIVMIKILKWMEKFILNQSKKITVLSEYSKKIIENDFKIFDKIEIIPAGIDEKKFYIADNKIEIKKKLQLPLDKFILLSIRRLDPRMGLENLLESIKIIKENFSNFLLIIGGQGPEEKNLKKLMTEWKIENEVKLIGYVSEEELPLYYQASDLFILPTRSLEGFGIVILEALSCGIPVIGTPIGGIKEVLNPFKDKLLCKSNSSQDISNAIKSFFENYNEFQKMKYKYREYVLKNYSWELIINKIEKIYQNYEKN